jgi:hypothetical protein
MAIATAITPPTMARANGFVRPEKPYTAARPPRRTTGAASRPFENHMNDRPHAMHTSPPSRSLR